ncbi:hypothetical protein COO20_16065 [Thalassospira marina]|uniref:Uncharacterized protein n=1 Tax=Thalassospira marina TaxID=2048283 RepID=A0A2N3KRP6_9PROT|nr:hypothetical protein COO20_16065 [Thalassospira marina]
MRHYHSLLLPCHIAMPRIVIPVRYCGFSILPVWLVHDWLISFMLLKNNGFLLRQSCPAKNFIAVFIKMNQIRF